MVTLIVPIFNAEETIERCVYSIQAQTFNDFEAILVDDGSTDETLSFCRRIIENDSRFHVIHRKNGGVSAARNTGIESANGEYICFMDADDEISPNYLIDLYNGIQSYDLLIHGMVRNENGNIHDRRMQIEKSFNLQTDAISFFNCVNIERFGGPYCKLYRRSIIERNSLRFNTKIRLAEDLDFFLRYLNYCNNVKTENKCNYVYYQTNGSATTRIYSFEEEINIFYALDISWENLCSKYEVEALEKLHQKSLSYYVARIIPSIYRSKQSRRQRLNSLRSIPDYGIDAYKQWYTPETRLMGIIKMLISKRLFNLIDLIGRFLF